MTGADLLATLEQDAGVAWAQIPVEDKALAVRIGLRWLALHAREALGADMTTPENVQEARKIQAGISFLEAEVAEILASQLVQYVGQAGAIAGKFAIGLLKGAVPGLSAVLP